MKSATSCGLPKLWPPLKSMTYPPSRHCSVITPSHVSIYRSVPRNAGSPLARPSEPLTRESGATSTTRRPETSASTAKTRPSRQAFWVAVRRFWSGWQQSLIAVRPETVVRWHRGGFHLYWKLICKVRRPVGRRQTSKEVQELIFRMVVENPTWGAPRIHGELLMLGFDVSERTISRWILHPYIYRYTARAFLREILGSRG